MAGARGGNTVDEEGDMSTSMAGAAKGRVVGSLVKKHLVEAMVPVLVELKHKLQEARHPLLSNLLATLSALLKDHKAEVGVCSARPHCPQQVVAKDARPDCEPFLQLDLWTMHAVDTMTATSPRKAGHEMHVTVRPALSLIGAALDLRHLAKHGQCKQRLRSQSCCQKPCLWQDGAQACAACGN